MKNVKVPAVKKKNGKIVKANTKLDSHDDLETKGQRGFILSDGTFADREEAAKVAKKAKQVKSGASALAKRKKLHSENLRTIKQNKDKK
jgi:hypothetical protein